MGRPGRRASFEVLESRHLLSITLPTISNVSLAAGTTAYVPLNGADAGQTVSYSVTASNYSKLTTVMMPSTNKTLELDVNINGVTKVMDFQLFDNLSPATTAAIEALVTSGYYNGLQIYRNYKLSGTPALLQGGNDPPNASGTSVSPIKADQSSMAEEFNPNLQYTTSGLLGMARSGTPSSSSTEFFITEEGGDAVRSFLDYNYTIFGIQTVGASVDQTIAAMTNRSSTQDPNSLGYLATPVTITSAKIITDTQDGVLQISAPKGVTGTVTVTVTASDGTNTPVTKSFVVTIAADTTTNPANPFAAVIPTAPTSVAFVPPGGGTSSTTNLNNSTSGKALSFLVSGVTSGDTVEILADGNVIGQAIVPASSTSVTVTTYGSTTLTDGVHQFTAIQIAPSQTVSVTENSTALSKTANAPSFNSAAVQLTIDATPPQFSFPAAVTAVVGVPYQCQVVTTGGPVTYQLTSSPAGMAIDANGLITWTPTASQVATTQVTIQATDATGNTTPDSYSINVLATNSAPVLTAATPSLGTTESGTAKTISVASLINQTGMTTVTDSDTNHVFGIALVGTTGAGTWAYSTDGTTFTAVGTVAESSALLLPATASLRYTPTGSGNETATITYHAWDTTGGASTGRSDLTTTGATGGSTAFSTATDKASLAVVNACSISGYAYIDVDNDGLLTKNGHTHTVLEGVVVTLYQSTGTVVATDTTGSDGSYHFDALAIGTYLVKESQPAGYIDGKDSPGKIGGATAGTATNDQFKISLAASNTATGYNFGEIGLKSSMISLNMSLASTPLDVKVIKVGTAAAALDKTAPTGYAIAANNATVNGTTDTSTGFTFTGAEVGATYHYTISSDHGGTPITGVGASAISSAAQKITGINVSSLPDGIITYSVTLTDAAGNAGSAATITATLDKTPPAAFTITPNDATVNASNVNSTGFKFAGAEEFTTYTYTITSTGGGTPVTGTNQVSLANQSITGIDVHSLSDGTLHFIVTLTDEAGNITTAPTATAVLSRT